MVKKFSTSEILTSSFKRGVTVTPMQKIFCLCTCSCGSLTVKLALEFTSIVSEASVVDALRRAAANKNFGEFVVKVSSIKGILVIESTVTPPTGETTMTSPVHDGISSDFQRSGTDHDWWCFKILQLQARCGGFLAWPFVTF